MVDPAKRKKGCLGCLGLIALVLLISYLMGLGGSSTPSTVGVGGDGILRMDGSGAILLAIDPASYDALVSASVARDSMGVTQLITAGRVFQCPQGTRVRVIDRAMYRRKVRIMNGPQTGLAGWVSSDWVKPS